MQEIPTPSKKQPGHPLDDLIRTDRIPHIWCPGCGIGIPISGVRGAELERCSLRV